MADITIISDVATDLRNFAADALQQFGRPPAGSSFIAVGETAWDLKACDQLSVSYTLSRPSYDFPLPAIADATKSYPFNMCYYTIELVRCFPTLDDNGDAPSDAALTDASTGSMADAAVLWNAIVCVAEQYSRDTDGDVTLMLIDNVIVGPQGGMIGIQIHVNAGLVDPCACVPAGVLTGPAGGILI